MTLPPELDRIVRALHAAGYRALIAGGAVRDDLLGLTPKDFDIEVYGVSFDVLAELLAQHGRIDLVGQSFGVVKLTGSGGRVYDFSLPRRDSKIGRSHRDFLATFDPGITPQEACSRRDFTINAMAFDPVAGDLLDYFGGREDLRKRVLRATSAAFGEDPLRVLRGMQFACRFDLAIDPATAEQCRAIWHEYSTLAQERVAEEFMKWATKSVRPGRIAEYLSATGWIVHFPEIGAILNVPQDPEWHPEGDVGVHTMHVVDAAAGIAQRDSLGGDERAVLLFSALTHDFAKAGTTAMRERRGKIRWTAHGHEAAGGPVARAFLERIGIKAAIVDQVVPLVENHLAHSSLRSDVTPRSVRRLALRLAPASITQLLRLIEADHSGRPPLPPGLPETAIRIGEMAAAQAVDAEPMKPLILGRHVLPYFEGKAGPHIGEITRAAYEAQTDGVFSTEEEALAWLSAHMRSTRPGG
ncbi:MAG TPA: HD domain-containing protein [Bryobacteraceae bacterium]|nr:HD domain-containing protein [Bryobacteraceae bacterium]